MAKIKLTLNDVGLGHRGIYCAECGEDTYIVKWNGRKLCGPCAAVVAGELAGRELDEGLSDRELRFMEIVENAGY